MKKQTKKTKEVAIVSAPVVEEVKVAKKRKSTSRKSKAVAKPQEVEVMPDVLVVELDADQKPPQKFAVDYSYAIKDMDVVLEEMPELCEGTTGGPTPSSENEKVSWLKLLWRRILRFFK